MTIQDYTDFASRLKLAYEQYETVFPSEKFK